MKPRRTTRVDKRTAAHILRPANPAKVTTMTKQKPLAPGDFPVKADGRNIKKQDGTPVADTDDPAVAAEVAERLNEDEARREEDKWSA